MSGATGARRQARRARATAVDRALVESIANRDAELVERIARRAAAIVLERLARGIAGEPTEWSTRRGHGPPGYAARVWRELAPTIAGAVRRGRWWYVSRDALEHHERALVNVGLSARVANEAAATNPAWSPAVQALELGLRPRGARRE